jgi:2-polyprenyl-3-methyl-5-hydroxy-6-metoxy-1,4-benzoquinol methylase
MTSQIVWTPELVEKFWAHYLGSPDLYFSYSKGADVVFRSGKYLVPGAKALDYGCGTGYLLPHLLNRGCEVWGADLSDKVVDEVSNQIRSNPRFHGVFSVDRLQKQRFDVVTLLEVVEHLEDDILAKIASDIHDLLAPGGVVLVTTPNNERLEDNIVYCPISDVTFHRWQHVRTWTKTSVSAYFERAGFETVSVDEVNFRDARDTSSILRRAARTIIRISSPKSGLFLVARKKS